MKRMLWAGLLLGSLQAVALGDVVAQWDFNGTPDDGDYATGTTLPNVGAGTIGAIGGASILSSFAAGDTFGGSTDPVTGPSVNNDSALYVGAFPAQGADDETAGIEVNVSTVGFADVVISWDQLHGQRASRYWAFYYTVDGASWTRLAVDAGNANPGTTPPGGSPASTPGWFGPAGTFSAFDGGSYGVGDDWFNGRSVNLASIAGVADNPAFGFRLVASMGGGAQYEGSGSASGYGGTLSSGRVRFDMVTVSGTVPEPASLLLVGFASLLASSYRR